MNSCCYLIHFRYPATNKPAAVFHWLNHVNTDAEYIAILDADMMLRGPNTSWEFKAARGRRFLPLASKLRTMIKVFLHILSRFTPCESYPLQVRMNFTYFMALHDSYLISCDNEHAKLHTRNPDACDKVGGVIVMRIDDLRAFVLPWLLKTEEVWADGAHYATNITGDVY